MLNDLIAGNVGKMPSKRSSDADPRRWRERAIAWLALGFLVFAVALFGFTIHNLALFQSRASLVDRAVSILLGLSELYVAIYAVGYYLHVYESTRVLNIARKTRLATLKSPSVAIYIATYNEPREIIEETVNAVSLLSYTQKQIYVNCDHQSPEQAAMVADIAQRHGVNFIHRSPNTHFKAGGINQFLSRLGRDLPAADLLCIFDADSIPMPSFLREVVPYFEDDPRIAFVQTPQFYGNSAASPVAEAAGHQQAIFYQHIAEGKQQHNGMFCCGTNVIFRVLALQDIGGQVTSSVTEDFATSIALHKRGWRAQYCNTAYVIGIGPDTLTAYWTQQSRWSLGTMETCLASLPAVLFRSNLSLGQRWEYLLAGTYYFVGINTVLTLLFPVLFLVLNIRPLQMSPIIYLAAYLPSLVSSNWFFFMTMRKRGYAPRIIYLGQCLTTISFPVFISAAIAAILRRKRPFAVTPKDGGEVLPATAFIWQIGMIGLLAVAVVVGTLRLFTPDAPLLAMIINIVWCLYNIVPMLAFRRFNTPELALTQPGMIVAPPHKSEITLALGQLSQSNKALRSLLRRMPRHIVLPQPATRPARTTWHPSPQKPEEIPVMAHPANDDVLWRVKDRWGARAGRL